MHGVKAEEKSHQGSHQDFPATEQVAQPEDQEDIQQVDQNIHQVEEFRVHTCDLILQGIHDHGDRNIIPDKIIRSEKISYGFCQRPPDMHIIEDVSVIVPVDESVFQGRRIGQISQQHDPAQYGQVPATKETGGLPGCLSGCFFLFCCHRRNR
jgi:hypothetical protein